MFTTQSKSDMPPEKKIRKDSSLEIFLPSQGHTHGFVEQNTSYTRGYNQILDNVSNESDLTRPNVVTESTTGVESDEDERFLRLAREALVATASKSGLNDAIDPTIQDLLRRLQYASSPHGNPIKRSSKIKANENGQLMIQGFYQQFPDLSNDIFMTGQENSDIGSNHPSNRRNNGWNFLVGNPMSYNEAQEDSISDSRRSTSTTSDDQSLERGKISFSEDSERKFLCTKCSMSFRRSSDLKRHEKQHLKVPPNICHICGKGFARKDALKRHLGTQTCKRNAEKKLYSENLSYLKKRGRTQSNDSSFIDDFSNRKY